MQSENFTATIKWSPETRAGTDSRKVSGYASVFGQEAEGLPFRERIAPGAFKRSIQGGSQFLMWNHDHGKPLARAPKTLTLTEDARGLKIEATIAKTADGDAALELIRSGVVDSMSFGFANADSTFDGGVRVINEAELLEVSAVCFPAYSGASIEGRSVEELEATVRAMRAGKRVSVNHRSFYGPDSEHSYYRDVARRDRRQRAEYNALGDPVLQGRARDEDVNLGDARPDGTLEDCYKRLAAEEKRAASTTLGNMGEFIAPAGAVPGFIADEFVIAVRNASALAPAMRNELLPELGMTVSTGKFGSGSAVSVDLDGQMVTFADPTTSLVSAPVAVVAGEVDTSRQLAERALGGSFDTWLAGELGAALGEKLDAQLISGSGTNGQMLGVLNVSGIGTTTWTGSGTTYPTVFLGQLGRAASALVTANGQIADTVILAPRRFYWTTTTTAASGLLPLLPNPFKGSLLMNPVICPAVPINNGDGTRDIAIEFVKQESPLFTRPVAFRTFEETLSGTLSIRFQAVLYAAPMWNRRPTSIMQLLGSGMTTPTFTS